MLCFSVCFVLIYSPLLLDSPQLTNVKVDSKDSLENVETKWVAEIAENCQGVKLVLVALKCDLRERHADDDEDDEAGAAGAEGEEGLSKKDFIQYQQGLDVARRIGALRYLGRCLAFM